MINLLAFLWPLVMLGFGLGVTYYADTPWRWWLGGAVVALGYDQLCDAVKDWWIERHKNGTT